MGIFEFYLKKEAIKGHMRIIRNKEDPSTSWNSWFIVSLVLQGERLCSVLTSFTNIGIGWVLLEFRAH